MKPLLERLAAASWAMEPQHLQGVLRAAQSGEAQRQGKPEQRKRLAMGSASPVDGSDGTLLAVGDIGVLCIDGPLFNSEELAWWFCGTSYQALHRGMTAAEGHPNIRKIFLLVNSPGGECDGVNELAKRFASSSKPIEAHATGMCASAAVWLASQADRLTAEETAEVGSIGVRVGFYDYAKMLDAVGIREIEIISSQSPGKRSVPLDDEVLGRIQTRIDDLADIFVDVVATGRAVSRQTVLEEFGEGDVMIASKALSVGLIDGVSSLSDALAAYAAAPATTRVARVQRTTTMANSNKPTAGDSAEWQCSGCSEMMGQSAKAFCAKCAEDELDDEDEKEDEEDAKALGLDIKASSGARRMRMGALVDFERQVLAATRGKDQKAALEQIAANAAAAGQIADVQKQGRKTELRAELERGLNGANGKGPTLTLGAIQRTMASALRGETKKAWVAAMDGLVKTADEAKSTITAAQIVSAACSVDIGDEDLEALKDFAASQSPIAASTHAEPGRNGTEEAQELDKDAAKVADYANKARAALDRSKRPAAQ